MEEKCICKNSEGMWVDGICWECENKISKKQVKEWAESNPDYLERRMKELTKERNRISRKIATSKKATLKA